MSLNTVPTNYHEYEYSKFSVFKLKFMTTVAVFMPNAAVWTCGERHRGQREHRVRHRAGDEGTCISSIGEGEAQQRLA